MIVVGEPLHPSLYEWGPVTVIDPTFGPPKIPAIRESMLEAVRRARVFEPVFQNDMRLLGSPYAPATFGRIRVLDRACQPDHCCPRAFVFYDEHTREAIIDAWTDTEERTCTAWGHIEKVRTYRPALTL